MPNSSPFTIAQELNIYSVNINYKELILNIEIPYRLVTKMLRAKVEIPDGLYPKGFTQKSYLPKGYPWMEKMLFGRGYSPDDQIGKLRARYTFTGGYGG